jgi:hypothetical protein
VIGIAKIVATNGSVYPEKRLKRTYSRKTCLQNKKEKQLKFLSVLFNKGEHVWAGKTKYASNSIPQSDIDFDNTILISINPLKPDSNREDANVSAYRSFLIEMDEGTLKEQSEYIKELGLPYSGYVYSGGKSLHYWITLANDLPTEEIWRFYAQWLLNVVDRADKNCKNPTRMIRFTETVRPDTGKEQKLCEIRGRITQGILVNFLAKYRDKKPKTYKPKERSIEIDNSRIPLWVKEELIKGIHLSGNRNDMWFKVATQFIVSGYDEESMISALDGYFEEERSFGRKEWLNCLRSAYKINGKG